MDGVEATRVITARGEVPRVVVLTTFDLDEYAFAAIRAGASGFLLKDAERAELVTAVRAVQRGDGVLAPRVTRALFDRVAPQLEPDAAAQAPTADPTESLTEREKEVFLAIAQGLSTSEIADKLILSESTVKTHVGRVLAKLDARDRVHVVILAYELGRV